MATIPSSRISQSREPAHFAHTRQTHRGNVGDVERWLSLLAGGGLTLFGLTRRTRGSLVLALLGGGLVYRGVNGHRGTYGARGVPTAKSHNPSGSIPAGQGIKVERTITINRSAADLYRRWRDFSNLPHFMRHLKSVQEVGPNCWRWVARGPLGKDVAWNAEIIAERENELISWRSLAGSAVATAGSVHFSQAPGNRGTEVRVTLKYDPPAGKLGAGIAWLFDQAPGQQIQEDLRRFQQLAETGTLTTTEGQPRGHCGLTGNK